MVAVHQARGAPVGDGLPAPGLALVVDRQAEEVSEERVGAPKHPLGLLAVLFAAAALKNASENDASHCHGTIRDRSGAWSPGRWHGVPGTWNCFSARRAVMPL